MEVIFYKFTQKLDIKILNFQSLYSIWNCIFN